MALRLSQAADDDLLEIYVYGLVNFGLAQAETYHAALKKSLRFIEHNPRAVRERTELTPPIRAHLSGAHMILYQIDKGDDVLVIRIRHVSEDWLRDPQGVSD